MKQSDEWKMNTIVEFRCQDKTHTGMITGHSYTFWGDSKKAEDGECSVFYHIQKIEIDGDGEHFTDIPHHNIINFSPFDEFSEVVHELANV